MGLIQSQAVENADRSVRFTLNGSLAAQSLTSRFIQNYFGAGVQHIAFACPDIFAAADAAIPAAQSTIAGSAGVSAEARRNKAGGKVLSGLVRRREAERDLFLSPVGKAMPAAKPTTPSKRPAQSDKPSAPPSPAKPGSGALAALLGGALVLIGAKIDAITAWASEWVHWAASLFN